ncbi:MAG: GNAT family N-acetyltransferase [Deltaproteobacteria bacterium]|nr:GNAT family N-acetyltransferase [Candidatus Zymogenaceae bacterium]
MTITEAHPDDAKEILAVQKRAFAPQGELYGDPALPPLTETEETIRESFEAYTVLKAVKNGVIVGAVRGRMKGERCLIGRLSVLPELQNRGIGRMLMREIESRFPEARSFDLFTGHKSEKSIGLYKKLGYEIFRTKKESDTLTLVFMRKGNEKNNNTSPASP